MNRWGLPGKGEVAETGHNPLFWPLLLAGHRRKSRFWLIAEDMSLRSTASDSWTCSCVICYRGSALFTPFNEKEKTHAPAPDVEHQTCSGAACSLVTNVLLWIINQFFDFGFTADVVPPDESVWVFYCFIDIYVSYRERENIERRRRKEAIIRGIV